jgi:ribose/xylose/arabinose/galactoside ABC-type transport system permease subunit
MTTGSIALNPHRWRERVANYGLLVALLVLMVIFSTINPSFFALATLLEQNTALFTLGLAPANDSLPLGIIAGFIVAVLVEVFNALLIVRAGINPLIVTLACWIWARGLAIRFTSAKSIPVLFEISATSLLGLLTFAVAGFILARTRLRHEHHERLCHAPRAHRRAGYRPHPPVVQAVGQRKG